MGESQTVGYEATSGVWGRLECPTLIAPLLASPHTLCCGTHQQSTGRTAFDVDIDGMEEQPWRHPGVDIADFFNYGFTEDSWRVYCEKQLRWV